MQKQNKQRRGKGKKYLGDLLFTDVILDVMKISKSTKWTQCPLRNGNFRERTFWNK